ncbi:MAG TPA: type II secretion system protein [Caulobacteraceae bacterium]|nr:type II secretion system protein [Caulobacteraceae bacterium]
MTPWKSSRSSAGFALIEALASLIIVGMICLMLIEGVGTGRRVWERMGARDAGGEAVDGAQATLRDRLEQTFPAPIADRSPIAIDFDGAAGDATFLSNPPNAARPAPLRRYRLSRTGAGELVLAGAAEPASGRDAAPTRQVLLAGVRRLDIAYYGAQGQPPTKGWWTSWRGQPAPPEVIRVRVAFEAGDRRLWPDLIVRPSATVDSDCALDPVTGRCGGHG